jgi:hypothetical protein
VPLLWPREAVCDQEMENPVYDESTPPKKRSIVSKLFGSTPIHEQPTIKIKKVTKVIVFPLALHYDDRFWVTPQVFIPERWDKQPDILARGNTPKIEVRSRTSVIPGLKGTRISGLVTKRRESILNLTSESTVSESLCAKVLGADHEKHQAEAQNDRLFECTLATNRDLQAWSFIPFGLGGHACLGRRLAVRMVDSIVFNLLEHNVKFYNGIVPSLFTRKQWYERTIAASAAYNYPADPVHVQISIPRTKTAVRRSCFLGSFTETGEIEGSFADNLISARAQLASEFADRESMFGEEDEDTEPSTGTEDTDDDNDVKETFVPPTPLGTRKRR